MSLGPVPLPHPQRLSLSAGLHCCLEHYESLFPVLSASKSPLHSQPTFPPHGVTTPTPSSRGTMLPILKILQTRGIQWKSQMCWIYKLFVT